MPQKLWVEATDGESAIAVWKAGDGAIVIETNTAYRPAVFDLDSAKIIADEIMAIIYKINMNTIIEEENGKTV